VPVTAKLSRQFYEHLGDELTNELVDWFNTVDATYRSELREYNDLNFSRFDSGMRKEFAALRVDLAERFAAIDLRFAAIDLRFAGLDARMAALDERFAALEGPRFAALEARIDDRFAAFEARIDARFSAFEARLFRWFVALLTTTLLAVVGIVVTVALRR
jgi:hypothetical protein